MDLDQYKDFNPSEIFGDQPDVSEVEDDPEDASGYGTALLSGLTNDEGNKIFWLATKRFPDHPDPSSLYYFDPESGDLTYFDPVTKQPKKEFKDGPFGFNIDYLDNVGPTGQFLAEVGFGTAGMTAGFAKGNVPGAIYGGIKGTAAGSIVGLGARQALTEVFSGPAINYDKAIKEKTIESILGGIPLGLPKGKLISEIKVFTPDSLKFIIDKFPQGKEGQNILSDIVQNGGKTVDDKLDYMAQKYPDIVITRAEASNLIGNAGYKAEVAIKKFLENEKLIEFYNDRNARLGYHAENFFDAIQQGKFAKPKVRDRLSGETSVDPDMDVAEAAKKYIDAEKEKLIEQTRPLYKQAYASDAKIDVSDIAKQMDDVIKNPNTSNERRRVYKKLREAITDKRFEKDTLRSSTELLHKGLKDNFRRQIARLTKDEDAGLKREVSRLKATISNRMKEANPIYKQVTSIYDDAFGTSQILDRGIVGQFANVIEKGGEAAGRLTKKLFTGKIKPVEVEELKKILQSTEEGAQAWQNLKGSWLSTQFDEVVTSQKNPLNEPNAYLRAIGIKQPERAFALMSSARRGQVPVGIAPITTTKELTKLATESQAKSKMAKLWTSILDPDELREFIDLTSLMQMLGKIQTIPGANKLDDKFMDTFAKQAKRYAASKRSGLNMDMVKGLFATILNKSTALPRFGVRTGKDVLIREGGTEFVSAGSKAAQQEAFGDLLISHIVDPRKRVVLKESLDATRPLAYAFGQTLLKGADAAERLLDVIREDDEQQEIENTSSMEQGETPVNAPENIDLSSRIQDAMPAPMDLPLFDDETQSFTSNIDPATSNIDPARSQIILPSEIDREIAMRMQMQMQDNKGIAGLG